MRPHVFVRSREAFMFPTLTRREGVRREKERVFSALLALAALLVGLLLIPMAAQAGVILPAARYRQDLDLPGPDVHRFVPGNLSYTHTYDGRGYVNASLTSTGGALPFSSLDLKLSGHSPNGINVIASAALTYYWTVDQVFGDPYFGTIPVLIKTRGWVSSSGHGDADVGDDFNATASFSFPAATDIHRANLAPSPSHLDGFDSFDDSYRRFVGLEELFWVSLSVRVQGVANDGGELSLSAYVDPLMVIDPAFSRAGDFRLRFSDGIGPVSIPPPIIPEPATWWLLGTGLIALLVRVKRRHRT